MSARSFAAPAARVGYAERALRVLGSGPLTTATLASRVLGLAGNPGAAARAVWTLLGDDPRFTVSADGVWSVAPLAAAAESLRGEDWVVVDVETTGGTPDRGHRVTEVAAVWVSGHQVRDSWSSLVNPERPIPPEIVALTGISDAMVRGAPRFDEVAAELKDRLRGRVFVAHNASFDLKFVRAEMERVGPWVPEPRQLCTVRLSRKLLAHLPSRALGALIQHYGIETPSRHRALADATATADVLIRLLDQAAEAGTECWSDLELLLGHRTARTSRSRRRLTPRAADSL